MDNVVIKIEQIEETSELNDNFIKYYNKESDERYFLEVDAKCPKKLHELCHFYLKERKLKEYKSLLLIYMIKINMLFT